MIGLAPPLTGVAMFDQFAKRAMIAKVQDAKAID